MNKITHCGDGSVVQICSDSLQASHMFYLQQAVTATNMHCHSYSFHELIHKVRYLQEMSIIRVRVGPSKDQKQSHPICVSLVHSKEFYLFGMMLVVVGSKVHVGCIGDIRGPLHKTQHQAAVPETALKFVLNDGITKSSTGPYSFVPRLMWTAFWLV